MKKTDHLKDCVCCENPNSRGMFCPKCYSVQTVFSIIRRYWPDRELPDLASDLRDIPIKEFASESLAKGAMISHRVAVLIQREGDASTLGPEDLRREIAREIERHCGEMRGIREWERKNNRVGAYMEHVKSTIGSWIGKSEAKNS